MVFQSTHISTQVTVWFGKGSTGDEREMAKVTKKYVFLHWNQIMLFFIGTRSSDHFRPLLNVFSQALAVTKNPEPELMFEGQEKGSFWSDLGGRYLLHHVDD